VNFSIPQFSLPGLPELDLEDWAEWGWIISLIYTTVMAQPTVIKGINKCKHLSKMEL